MNWLHLTFETLGGIGLFLLGMTLLTDGLKAFAGNALRAGLVKFTGSPLMAFGSGVVATLLVQSSTATTVTVIGFVSAGLLTFPQAIGVVIGASLGTTAISWLVAMLGLKVSVGFYALPMIGVGALMRMFARNRWQSLGLAVAGFGLIFVGIDSLLQGMMGLSDSLDFSELAVGGVAGQLLMVLIGFVMTVILQSSSAAVATTLTALYTDSLLFSHAMAIVIGAAIGTTTTGALAALGGTVAAKRTALAHVSFNAWSGLLALALLPVYQRVIEWAQNTGILQDSATGLAAFHSSFIAVGAITILPWIGAFSRIIEKILPEKQPALTRRLDPTVLAVPAVAIEATEITLREIAEELVTLALYRDENEAGVDVQKKIEEVRDGLLRARQFIADIPPAAAEPMATRRLALMHAMDHLFRLLSHAKKKKISKMIRLEAVTQLRVEFREALRLAQAGFAGEKDEHWVEELQKRSKNIAALRGHQRETLLRKTADGAESPEETLQMLDVLRWIDGSVFHTWRIAHYLVGRKASETDMIQLEEAGNGSMDTQTFEGL